MGLQALCASLRAALGWRWPQKIGDGGGEALEMGGHDSDMIARDGGEVELLRQF